MRLVPYLCALVLGVGAALVAGCGDRSNLIPPTDAAQLKTELDAVRQAVDERRCGDTQRAIARARSAVANLPDDVDPRLRSRLLSGIGRLSGQANTACEDPPATTQQTIPTTATTAPPETTSTETTPTTPPETTTTDTTPTTPVDPTQTEPGAGGVTPTDTGTGTTPAPDPGGATPTTPGDGSGFRSVAPASPRRDGTGRRDREGAQGYLP